MVALSRAASPTSTRLGESRPVTERDPLTGVEVDSPMTRSRKSAHDYVYAGVMAAVDG
jgi:hypothetical protein